MKNEIKSIPIIFAPFKEQSCETCLFFYQDCDHVDKQYICKRYPLKTDKLNVDWCGEWKKDEENEK